MHENQVARAETIINAPVEKTWDALVNAESIKKYMFGTSVSSDWKEGSPITWRGEWQGKAYEDKGTILEIIPNRKLRYTHFSPLSGKEDKPGNYHTVTVELSVESDQTKVCLSQDNNPTQDARKHSEKNWTMMLNALKNFLEGNS